MGVRGIAATLPSGAARRPVLLMALGSFTLGTDAFVISGVLPSVGKDLGVGVATAGLLITVFAAVYALAAPVLAVGTGSLDRRRVLVGSLGGFVAANLMAALAPDYTVMMIARVLAAFSAALYMPAASASAAAIVEPAERGRALTAVLGGLTLASALGVPIGTTIGSLADWRATFVFVAALSLVALAGIARALPAVPSAGVASLRDRAKAAALPGIPGILLGSVLTFCAMFVLYAYLAWFAQHTAGIQGGAVTWVYLVYGVCGVVSNQAAGWLIDRYPPQRVAMAATALLVPVLGLAVVLARTGGTGLVPAALLYLVVVLWSLIGWTVNPAQQKRLINAGGQHAPVVLSLSGSAVYSGQALGSLVGGLMLVHGATPLAVAALALQVLTLAVMALSVRSRRAGAAAAPESAQHDSVRAGGSRS
ncbi:MFS transporter [Streptacidiphilus jiangxiensis]|uniref:Predicted arabinose efflux permease, MFS family n=1 Tax=Streptacidiphilus jiangxiensis TaxID=235985 RepID=A0A1H7VPL3_STRJI|nr:MFS transporter [Streptacidiphilus jiangxiensis]SEM10718.1 Predicted arabinose efflux permease, MFS family [Streptacidiphilus jiangxiensis]